MGNDSARKVAFAAELKISEKEIARLEIANKIPDAFKDIKDTVKDNAFDVLTAMLNLVGEQLLYFATALGKTGLPSSLRVLNHVGRLNKMVFTDTQDAYKAAGDDFRDSVACFNQSLHDANLLMVIGRPSVRMNVSNL
jgi:hypothetical protein